MEVMSSGSLPQLTLAPMNSHRRLPNRKSHRITMGIMSATLVAQFSISGPINFRHRARTADN